MILIKSFSLNMQKILKLDLIVGYLTTFYWWCYPSLDTRDPFSSGTEMNLDKWTKRTRKLITMHKALHPRDDVDRLYVPRKEGGRGLASIEDSVDTPIQRLEVYIETHERGLIMAIRNNTDNTIDNKMTIRVMVIRNWGTWNAVPKGLEKHWRNWKLEEILRSSRLQQY